MLGGTKHAIKDDTRFPASTPGYLLRWEACRRERGEEDQVRQMRVGIRGGQSFLKKILCLSAHKRLYKAVTMHLYHPVKITDLYPILVTGKWDFTFLKVDYVISSLNLIRTLDSVKFSQHKRSVSAPSLRTPAGNITVTGPLEGGVES